MGLEQTLPQGSGRWLRVLEHTEPPPHGCRFPGFTVYGSLWRCEECAKVWRLDWLGERYRWANPN